MTMFLSNGHLHAPYFIFLKCAEKVSDSDLLAAFGINDHQQISTPPLEGPHATFCTCGDWTLIADDWYYSLWHSETTRPAINSLAERADIFAYSFGECDNSFDFVYYLDGELVRKFVVLDPDFKSSIVKEDFGDPLPGEIDALTLNGELLPFNGELERLMKISDSLGIPRPKPTDKLRLYSHSKSWMTNFKP